MWRFVSLLYTKFDLYCVHPTDLAKLKAGEITDHEFMKRRIKVRFQNGIFETDNKKTMEALYKHPHYGDNGLFVLDREVGLDNLDTIDKYGADKPLYDKLQKLKAATLKSYAHDKEIAPWSMLRKMSKDEVIDLMIKKKSLLGEIANVTE